MLIRTTAILLSTLNLHSVLTSAHTHHRISQDPIQNPSIPDPDQEQDSNDDPIPYSTRAHWMHVAKSALLDLTGSPCPFQPFGTAIVNHTGRPSTDPGQLICVGANQNNQTGNPTLHGEIAAINNCTAVLSSAPYNLSPSEISTAWADLSLYTTAEACTMCASAVNWAGFSEYVYGTRLGTLLRYDWFQIPMTSRELLDLSPRRRRIRVVDAVAEEDLDELFRWQFAGGECPTGCVKGDAGFCVAE